MESKNQRSKEVQDILGKIPPLDFKMGDLILWCIHSDATRGKHAVPLSRSGKCPIGIGKHCTY